MAVHTRTHTRYFTLPDLAGIMTEAHKLQEDWNGRREFVDKEEAIICDGLIANLQFAITSLLQRVD